MDDLKKRLKELEKETKEQRKALLELQNKMLTDKIALKVLEQSIADYDSSLESLKIEQEELRNSDVRSIKVLINMAVLTILFSIVSTMTPVGLTLIKLSTSIALGEVLAHSITTFGLRRRVAGISDEAMEQALESFQKTYEEIKEEAPCKKRGISKLSGQIFCQ